MFVARVAAAWATADWATTGSGARWAVVLLACIYWYSSLSVLLFAVLARALHVRRRHRTSGIIDFEALRRRERRPREVRLGGRRFAVQPLTMQAIAEMYDSDAMEPVAALSRMGSDVINPALIVEAYEAMYTQLPPLLRDVQTGEPPTVEFLKAYLSVEQMANLLQQLGPQGVGA